MTPIDSLYPFLFQHLIKRIHLPELLVLQPQATEH